LLVQNIYEGTIIMMLLDTQITKNSTMPALPSSRVGSQLSNSKFDHLWVRGRLVINLDTREVTYNEMDVTGLTKTEYQILLTLAERPGYVFTRAALEKLLYSDSALIGPRTVAVHISNLRSKLPEPGVIKTLYGVGYKLITNI
jgi:DNA-binding response OmpR family regulator